MIFKPEEEGSKPVSGGCASSNLGGVRAVIRGCAASSALFYSPEVGL